MSFRSVSLNRYGLSRLLNPYLKPCVKYIIPNQAGTFQLTVPWRIPFWFGWVYNQGKRSNVMLVCRS